MNALLSNAVTHWKSTVQSILTTTLAVTAYLMVSGTVSPKTAGIALTVNGLAKVLLGALQTDGIVVPPDSTVKSTTTITTPPSK